MNEKVFEMVKIERHGEALEADLQRVGRRYIPALIQHGASAVLVHEDDHSKSLVTSRVEEVGYEDGDNTIVFTTKHTTYTLGKVGATQ